MLVPGCAGHPLTPPTVECDFSSVCLRKERRHTPSDCILTSDGGITSSTSIVFYTSILSPSLCLHLLVLREQFNCPVVGFQRQSFNGEHSRASQPNAFQQGNVISIGISQTPQTMNEECLQFEARALVEENVD